MDWLNQAKKLTEKATRYKYALLILGLGLVLMWFPWERQVQPEASEPAEIQKQTDPEDRLEEILSQVQGAGKVRVLLTESAGEQTLYQTDEDESQSSDTHSHRSDTVVVTGSDRAQTGLVRQVNPPEYLGAIIVCQGADRPAVCLAIVEAVSAVTGISSDRISVLKMK